MRLTVNLDPEVYQLAKSISLAEDISLSAAVNKLLLRTTAPPPSPLKKKRGFPTSRGKRRFTSEEVYKIEQM